MMLLNFYQDTDSARKLSESWRGRLDPQSNRAAAPPMHRLPGSPEIVLPPAWNVNRVRNLSFFAEPSNQINFIYIAQKHNHVASVGFSICAANNILRLSIGAGKNLPFWGENKLHRENKNQTRLLHAHVLGGLTCFVTRVSPALEGSACPSQQGYLLEGSSLTNDVLVLSRICCKSGLILFFLEKAFLFLFSKSPPCHFVIHKLQLPTP